MPIRHTRTCPLFSMERMVAVGGTAINMAISMGTSMAMQDTEKMKSEEKRIQDVAL